MQIRNIKIEDLFGTFTHEINFSDDANITMILGRNGLGKTIILKIIKAIFDGNLFHLERIEFSKIKIDLNESESWVLAKEIKESEDPNEDGEQALSLAYYVNDIEQDKVDYSSISRNLERLKRALMRHIPIPVRPLENDEWVDRRTEARYSTSELIEKYRQYIPDKIFEKFVVYPDWYSEKISGLDVALIETQRLLTLSNEDDYKYRDRRSTVYKQTVEEYSDDLVRQIHFQLAKSSELSTKLDRTYPNRLIERLKKTTNITQTDLNNSLEHLEAKRRKLHEVGLLDFKNQPHIGAIDEEQDDKIRDVLQVYIEDSQEKLEVYDQLADKISLFLKIVNGRFLKKELSISREKGFQFKSTKTGKDILLKNLSSGEQHILVLYYELLFKLNKGTLLLMDEPEISLHIGWQKLIINDLKEILKLNPMEIIIATHSPAVIGKNWNLTVELDAE